MEFNFDLKSLLRDLKVSQVELSNTSGIGKSTINGIVKNGRIPNLDTAYKLASALDISLDYMATGKKNYTDGGQYTSIPFYGDAPVSAGGGSIALREVPSDTFVLDENWTRKNIGNPDDVMAFPVIGDSMHPTLEPNDILICLRVEKFEGDGIYIVRLDDCVMVKRLSLHPNSIVKVTSDNSNHTSFDIDLKEEQNNFDIIAAVRTYIRNT